MTRVTKDTLSLILAPIDRSATSIEGAFLQAGDSLGNGLAAFERLSTSVTSLSGDLESGGLSKASSALEGLSQELRLISADLPKDAATLEDLVAGNDRIAKRLASLLENARMMMIIARSARIEAVVFDEGLGLDAFSQEVSSLTGTVQAEIRGWATDHAKLRHLIKNASFEQGNLDRDFRERLIEIAEQLLETFALIQERKRGGAGLMQEIVERSNRITQSTGMAMISLQSGDSTRQRLEHIIGAVQGAVAIGEDRYDAIEIPLSARPAVIATLCQLQAAQLRDAVADFDSDVASIDAAILSLIGDAGELCRNSMTLYGSREGGSESFLTVFRSTLASAASLLEICQASRHSVERATTGLRSLLSALHETISKLNSISSHLVLLGVNAGLKAGRLGSGGRSLVVIADEIKRLASDIAKDTQDLMQVFEQVQSASRRLDRDAALGAHPQASEVDREIASIIDDLDAGDRQIADFLKTLTRNAEEFDVQLNQARRDFGSAVSMNADLLQAASLLDDFAQGPGLDECTAEGRSFIDAMMSPKYTMAREREIHAAIVGMADEDDAAPEAPAPETWELADVLFA